MLGMDTEKPKCDQDDCLINSLFPLMPLGMRPITSSRVDLALRFISIHVRGFVNTLSTRDVFIIIAIFVISFYAMVYYY